MYKESLRKFVEDGKGYGSDGMIIYANFEAYKEINTALKKGQHKHIYDTLLKNVKEGKKLEVYSEKAEGKIYAFIAFPLKNKEWDKAYYNEVLELCNKAGVNGPVVYVP